MYLHQHYATVYNQPSLILKELNEEMKTAFRQDRITNHIGMDIAVCMCDRKLWLWKG